MDKAGGSINKSFLRSSIFCRVGRLGTGLTAFCPFQSEGVYLAHPSSSTLCNHSLWFLAWFSIVQGESIGYRCFNSESSWARLVVVLLTLMNIALHIELYPVIHSIVPLFL